MIINETIYISKSEDNIAVALREIAEGESFKFKNETLQIEQRVPAGANLALEKIKAGRELKAFAIPFATARNDLKKGELLRSGPKGNINELEETHSLKGKLIPRDLSEILDSSQAPTFFLGYHHGTDLHGRAIVGVENNILCLTTVDCVGKLSENIAALGRTRLLSKYKNVNHICQINCGSGCGMPAGTPREELANILVAIMNNPNVSHVLLIGLGCEQISINPKFNENYLDYFAKNVHNFEDRVTSFTLQSYVSELEAIEKIVEGPLNDLCKKANEKERKVFDLSHLTIGVKCGGSDRFSMLTSNPSLGAAADCLAARGGNIIISETPEFEGVINLMAERAIDSQTANWINDLLPRFEKLSQSYPIPASGKQHVAPGNEHGGLINAKLKSIGAMLKAGTGPVVGGLEYYENIRNHDKHGLFLLNCPSFDPISTTALGLSGAQIVIFTTGLGTPVGSALSKVIKVGNNPKTIGIPDHIDFFANETLSGKSEEEVGLELFKLIVQVASGKIKTKVEEMDQKLLGAGLQSLHHEFLLWKRWGDN